MNPIHRHFRRASSAVAAFMLVALAAACTENSPSSSADAANVARVDADLKALSQIVVQAQRNSKGTVVGITKSHCTDCVCRDRDIRKIPDSDPCAAAWLGVVKSLEGLQNSGTSAKAPVRDPWGSPYALDENQGESGPAGCTVNDELRSVGPDGRWGTADDITIKLPLSASCP